MKTIRENSKFRIVWDLFILILIISSCILIPFQISFQNVVYRLSEKNRKKMESEDQELAAEFHRLIIIMIGNQLMKASRAMVDSIN